MTRIPPIVSKCGQNLPKNLGFGKDAVKTRIPDFLGKGGCPGTPPPNHGTRGT